MRPERGLCCVLLLVLLPVSGPARAADNLLRNGDFDEGAAATGPPPGWSLIHGLDPSILHRDEQTRASGAASLRFDFTGAGQPAWIAQQVNGIHPDTEYRIEGSTRCSPGAQVQLLLNVEPNLGGKDLPATTGWTHWSFEFNSQEATSVGVQLRFSGTGTVWVDALRLEQVGQAGANILPGRRQLLEMLSYQAHPVDPATNTEAWTRPYRGTKDPARVFHRASPVPAWKVGQWVRYVCRDQVLVPSVRPEKRPQIALIDCAVVGREKVGGKTYYWYQSVVRLDKYWVSRSTGLYDSGEKILLARPRRVVLSFLVDGPDFNDIRRYQLKVDDEPLLEYTAGGRAVLPQLSIDHAFIRPGAALDFASDPAHPTGDSRGFSGSARTGTQTGLPNASGAGRITGAIAVRLLPCRPVLGSERDRGAAVIQNAVAANVPITGLLQFDYHGPQLDRTAALVNWGGSGARDQRGGDVPLVLQLAMPPYVGVAFDGFGGLPRYQEMAAAGADLFESQGMVYLGDARRFFNRTPVYFYNDNLWDLDQFDFCRSNFVGFSEMLDEPYQRQRKQHEYVKPGEAVSLPQASQKFSAALAQMVRPRMVWPGQGVMDYDSPSSAAWYAYRAGTAGFVMENDRLTQEMDDVARVTGRKDARTLVDAINIGFLRGAARRFAGWWGQGLYRWSPAEYYQDELVNYAQQGASYVGFWIEGGRDHQDPDLTFYHQVLAMLPKIAAAVHAAAGPSRAASAAIVVPDGYVVGLPGAPASTPWGIIDYPRGQAITDQVIARASQLFDRGITFDIVVDDATNPPALDRYAQVIRVTAGQE